MSDLSILIGDTQSKLRALAQKDDVSKAHLLSPTSLLVSIAWCLVPAAVNLTDLKVVVRIPDLSVQVSDSKLWNLMLLGNAAGESLKILSQEQKNQITVSMVYLKELLFANPFVTTDPYTRKLANQLLEQKSEEQKEESKANEDSEKELSPEDTERLLTDRQLDVLLVINNIEIYVENEK